MSGKPEKIPLDTNQFYPQPPASSQRQEQQSTLMSEAPANAEEMEKRVIAVLKTCYDPEVPVDIYSLGLIYNVDVAEDFSVNIRMTLTSPACPVAETLPGEVKSKVAALPGVKSSEVELVWEPTWNQTMMTEEAAVELGLF